MDLEAPARTEALIDSPSYRRADQAVNFLERDEAHRLQLYLDYRRPDLSLEEQGVLYTIVVYGSTRTTEPTTAGRRVERLQRER